MVLKKSFKKISGWSNQCTCAVLSVSQDTDCGLCPLELLTAVAVMRWLYHDLALLLFRQRYLFRIAFLRVNCLSKTLVLDDFSNPMHSACTQALIFIALISCSTRCQHWHNTDFSCKLHPHQCHSQVNYGDIGDFLVTQEPGVVWCDRYLTCNILFEVTP